MSVARRAVAFTPMETRRELLVELAQIAEGLGYEFFVVPEAWGHDSTVLLTQVADATERIRPMSGILSVWGRTAGTLAMNTASLLDVSNGRYVLGLGVSTPELAEGFHRVTYERPAWHLSDVAKEVRSLLGGQRATLTPELNDRARPLPLGLKVEHQPAIAIAGMGPRTRQVAAEEGDYWIPVFIALSQMQSQIDDLKSRRAAVGLKPADLEVFVGPNLAVDDDLDVARQSAAAVVGWYIVAMGDNYARLLTEQGFGAEVQAVLKANPKPKPGTCVIPPEAQALLDELAVITTLEDADAALAPWDSVGDVTMVGLPPGASRSTLIRLLEAAAPR